MPVKGAVPPAADTVTDVDPPKHVIVPADDDATNANGWVIVPVVVEVQPLASVTV